MASNSTGWDNGLCQDYNGDLGRWFANRLGAKHQLRKEFEMTSTQSISLPSLGSALEGGTFAGITTRADGTHCAVVLLPGKADDLTWNDAKAWAEEQGGELPTRPVAAMLFANVKPALSPEWHWTADEYNASYAWNCYFNGGFIDSLHKSYEGSAVAVRLIPLKGV